jgi:hypothetical protein
MDWKRGVKRIFFVLAILWFGGILLLNLSVGGNAAADWWYVIKLSVIGAVAIAIAGEIIILIVVWIAKGFIKAKPDKE